jgi:hypothetical protein
MLVSLKRPVESEYKSVQNFIHDEKPQCEEEETWIQCKEDLFTLRPGREHAWLDAGIEHLLRRLHCPLIEYIFCSKVVTYQNEYKTRIRNDNSSRKRR